MLVTTLCYHVCVKCMYNVCVLTICIDYLRICCEYNVNIISNLEI